MDVHATNPAPWRRRERLDCALQLADGFRISESPKLDRQKRSKLGQFMTPERVASFMARQFSEVPKETRLLDAGAGMGALTAAVVARACSSASRPRSIEVTAFEVDPILVHLLKNTMQQCKVACDAAGILFVYEIIECDFILAMGSPLIDQRRTYNLVIMNPPYGKITSTSDWRNSLRKSGIETGNFYSAFVALALNQMEKGAEIVAITPRSFCNGVYFERFRKQFLSESALEFLHVFDSRREAFKDDEVLQESVIFRAVKGKKPPREVSLSSDNLGIRECSYSEVVHPNDPHAFIRFLSSDDEFHLSERMQSLPCALRDLRIEVSTGRVVDFRAKEHLRKAAGLDDAPLLYPGHFDRGEIAWPKQDFKKHNALEICDSTRKLLVPSGIYVLVKRFSSKEETRRVVAARYDAERECGFENHLNYFHSSGQGLDPDLATGLAVFLNSTKFDRYFRQFSGHTQVNATDLRGMRYPSKDQLTNLAQYSHRDADSCDAAVEEVLQL